MECIVVMEVCFDDDCIQNNSVTNIYRVTDYLSSDWVPVLLHR